MKAKPGAYEYLEHTADAKFRAHGKSFEELFRNAGRALFGIITSVDRVKPRIRSRVRVRAKSLEALLFDFLDQLLFLLDTRGFLLHDCENARFSRGEEGLSFECDALGDHHREYEVSGNVKAVTYHGMRIEQRGSEYVAEVVVDI